MVSRPSVENQYNFSDQLPFSVLDRTGSSVGTVWKAVIVTDVHYGSGNRVAAHVRHWCFRFLFNLAGLQVRIQRPPALRQTCLLLLEYNGRGWITQLLLPALFPRPLTILFLRSTYIWNRERVFQEPERGLRRALSEPQSTLQPWLHSGDHTQKSYGRWTQSYRMKLNGPIGKVLFVAWKRQLPENLII